MMKQKTNGRGIAFTLALALIFSTLFTGLGIPGFGQMGDKENWGVEEAYAAAASAPTVDAASKIIYANGTPLIVSQGAVDTTATAIYTSSGGMATVVTFAGLDLVNTGDGASGYDLSGYAIYGGCSNAAIDATSITMTGGTVDYVYGGGANSGATVSSTAVEISGGTVSTVYGGGVNSGATVSSTAVEISGNANISGSVYGGGNSGAVSSTAVEIRGGTVNTVYGGGANGAATVSSTAVTISGGTASNVYGGGMYGAVNGEARVTMTGGTVNNVYGGGDSGAVSSTAVEISGNAVIDGNVYGGGGGSRSATVSSTAVEISGNANITYTVYGGGFSSSVTVISTAVEISGGKVDTVYGGGYSGAVSSAAVEISGGKVDTVYGGGNNSTATVSSTAVTMTGGTVDSVYGGGVSGAVSTTAVEISGNANITYSVYGGGVSGAVSSTAVEISGNPTISGIVINGVATINGVDKFNIAGPLTGADGNIVVELPSGFTGGAIFATSSSTLTDADAKKFTLTGDGASDKAIRVSGSALVAVRCIGKVQNLSLTAGDGSLKATWEKPRGDDWGEVTYRVKASGGSLVNWAYETTDTAYSFSGLTNGTVYTVKVSAVSSGVEGDESVVTGTPKADSNTGGGGSGGSSSGGSTAPSGSFSISKGDIKNVGNSNGQITFKNSSVKAGEKAVMTITANTAYEVGKVVVKDKDGKVIACKDNGDGTYSFTMPQSKVTVDVEYAPVFGEKKNTPSFDRTILSKQKVTLNGKSVEMDAYNVDGYNYMKLRDIAYLLKDTSARFEVTAGSSYSITASPGKSYTAVGGELAVGSDKAETCVVSKWRVTIDGIERYLNVYNIGGNNYFKLVDLGQLLGFGVVYEQATNTAAITTK